MAKIGTFGKLRFKISDREALIFQNMKRELSGKWNQMERIGQKPLVSFGGPELQKITFTVFLDAGLGVSPRDLLEEMEEMAERGTAEYLIIGQRQVGSGRGVLVKSSEAWDKILTKGELLRATAELTLQEYV